VYGLREIYKRVFNRKNIFRHQPARIAVMSLIILGFAEPVVSTIKNYPFGNVYFNIAARIKYKEMRTNFEMDYWGLSYRKGLEYLMRSDTSSNIRISSTDEPCFQNMMLIPNPGHDRLEFVRNRDEADYFLTTCRSRPQPYELNEVFNVRSQGEKILFVYKLK